jgi:superfamily II DNA or RNA helicase
MSVNINTILNTLPILERQKISTNLTIEYQLTQFGRKPNFFMFEIEEAEDRKNAFVPFAYYYQYLLKFVPEQSFPNEQKKYPKAMSSLDFVGSLTEKQQLVRPEVIELLNRTHSCILSFHCGFGKTIFSIYLSCIIKLKTCILAHRVNLIDQWYYSIKKVCPSATIQILNTKSPINKENDFFIINSANVSKRQKEDFKDIGVLIVDEAHTICTEKLAKGLFHFQPKYMFGLTATPHRTDGMSRILELFFGPEIIERKLKRSFNVYALKTNFVPETRTTQLGNLDWNFVLSSQCSNIQRNLLIVKIIRYFRTRNILVLCKQVKQSKTLLNYLQQLGENVDMFVSTQKKFDRDSRVLISTFSKTGVGFDHPKLDLLVIASDVEEGIEQYVGRIFRRDDTTPIVIDIIDKFRPLQNHFATRKKLYTEIGGDVKDFQKVFFKI